MGLSVSVQAAPFVDLNLPNFFADPTVTVSASGFSADFAEDPGFFTVLLANDPAGFGDPAIFEAGAGVSLIFEFEFVEAPGEDDEFGAFIIDQATGVSPGAAFEFFTGTSSAGTVTFDLTGLTPGTIGLQFSLSAGFGDTGFGSTAKVSNVHVVPEPGSLLLFSAGVGGLLFRRRRSKGRAASAS